MNTIDIVVVLLFIPICDRSLYPRLVARGIATTPARRMAAGYAFASVAMFAAAGCERARLHAARTLPLLSAEPGAAADALQAARYSLMWQTPQYFLTGLAEVLEAVAEADFFYSIAPVELRSIFMALRRACHSRNAGVDSDASPSTRSCSLVVATALGGYFASFEIQIAQRTTRWMADDLNVVRAGAGNRRSRITRQLAGSAGSVLRQPGRAANVEHSRLRRAGLLQPRDERPAALAVRAAQRACRSALRRP